MFMVIESYYETSHTTFSCLKDAQAYYDTCLVDDEMGTVSLVVVLDSLTRDS